MNDITESQLHNLDDTDHLASAWDETLRNYYLAQKDGSGDHKLMRWGGRGKGGRGIARRTLQPQDILVDSVYLEYLAQSSEQKHSRILLDGTSDLRLFKNRIYALCGRNGCGKSTLLKRINACKIPGFPPHISTCLVPQEVLVDEKNENQTALEVLLGDKKVELDRMIAALEEQLDEVDMENEEEQGLVEKICEDISKLEEERDEGCDVEVNKATEALRFFDIDRLSDVKMGEMSGGERKKVALAAALHMNSNLYLFDEPTNHLDISGIIQLRRLILLAHENNATVLIVSHDIDLINDVVDNVIHMEKSKLMYYSGNYREFLIQKENTELNKAKQANSLAKEREALVGQIDRLRKQTAGKHGDKKKGKQLESRKKKLERLGVMKNEHGHRWTVQNAATGIREGSINALDASSRKKLSYQQLMKQSNIAPVPDKAVQFKFRDSVCTYGEPLITVMDLSFGYPDPQTGEMKNLFSFVDYCFEEGSRTFILGSNGSGKSSFLKLLAGETSPAEGKIHFAQGAKICYFSQHIADELIVKAMENSSTTSKTLSALSFYMEMFDKKEQDAHEDLSRFGLDSYQIRTDLKFLSGGERCRLCLTTLVAGDTQPPDCLIFDEPSNHLDTESVEALRYGVEHYKGTIIMVSHDAHLIRGLGGQCLVLKDGRMMRIERGIDGYLNSVKKHLGSESG